MTALSENQRKSRVKTAARTRRFRVPMVFTNDASSHKRNSEIDPRTGHGLTDPRAGVSLDDRGTRWRTSAERFADRHSGTVAALLHRHRPGSRDLCGFRDVQASCRHRPRHVVQAGEDRPSRRSDTADRATADRDDADDEQRLPHRRQQPRERQRRQCLRPAPVHRRTLRALRHRPVPHPVHLFPHGLRRSDRLPRPSRRRAPPHVLRQHRHERVEHRAVDPRHGKLDLPGRDGQSHGVLGAVDDRHRHRQADRSRLRRLLLQAGLHARSFQRDPADARGPEDDRRRSDQHETGQPGHRASSASPGRTTRTTSTGQRFRTAMSAPCSTRRFSSRNAGTGGTSTRPTTRAT